MRNLRNVGKQCLKEHSVPRDIGHRDVDGQWDYPGTFEAQRGQSLPPTAYRCPIPGTGSDGFTPVPADVGQGDDRSGISGGDEGGAQRDDFGRETVHGSQRVPQGDHFMEDVFGSLL